MSERPTVEGWGLQLPAPCTDPLRCLSCSQRVNCLLLPPSLPRPAFQISPLKRLLHLCSFEFCGSLSHGRDDFFSLSLQFPRSQSCGQVACSAVSRMEFSRAAGEGQSWFLSWPLGAADLIKPGLLSVCVLKSAPALILCCLSPLCQGAQGSYVPWWLRW